MCVCVCVSVCVRKKRTLISLKRIMRTILTNEGLDQNNIL